MPEDDASEITHLLDAMRRAEPGAADAVARRVAEELHLLAEAALRREVDGHTLQATELVDEAFVRLMGQREVTWQNRSHFYAVAARTIRRILLDHARRRQAHKRDHGLRITLDEAIRADAPDALDLIALDTALERLAELSPRQAQVVELRFFGGLENEDVAEALGISTRTAKRDWTFARAYLLEALREEG